jgi:hypothetical protein
MSLLGEEIVEEWLNRKGYFTIRGVKLGLYEMDVLAIKPLPNGEHECRHVEITLSVNPISYISKVPKAIQKERGIGANNAKRRDVAELKQGVAEWIEKKFDHPGMEVLRQSLCPGKWKKELVLNKVRHEEEIALFQEAGIEVFFLKNLVSEMVEGDNIVQTAAGADLVDLVLIRELNA